MCAYWIWKFFHFVSCHCIPHGKRDLHKNEKNSSMEEFANSRIQGRPEVAISSYFHSPPHYISVRLLHTVARSSDCANANSCALSLLRLFSQCRTQLTVSNTIETGVEESTAVVLFYLLCVNFPFSVCDSRSLHSGVFKQT